MLKKSMTNLLKIFPCCFATLALAEGNVVNFRDWQVNYYTNVTHMTRDDLHSNWIVKPPLVLDTLADMDVAIA